MCLLVLLDVWLCQILETLPEKIPHRWGNTWTLKWTFSEVPTSARGLPPRGSWWQVHYHSLATNLPLTYHRLTTNLPQPYHSLIHVLTIENIFIEASKPFVLLGFLQCCSHRPDLPRRSYFRRMWCWEVGSRVQTCRDNCYLPPSFDGGINRLLHCIPQD